MLGCCCAQLAALTPPRGLLPLPEHLEHCREGQGACSAEGLTSLCQRRPPETALQHGARAACRRRHPGRPAGSPRSDGGGGGRTCRSRGPQRARAVPHGTAAVGGHVGSRRQEPGHQDQLQRQRAARKRRLGEHNARAAVAALLLPPPPVGCQLSLLRSLLPVPEMAITLC